ncbi:MAG: AarF/UbiB family protein [bacterium]|nr:AarF/UbiB family protein [bacterium]
MSIGHEDLQQIKREQIHQMLQRDAHMTEQTVTQEQSLFQNVEQMKANKEMIDQALQNTVEFQLTDKEAYRLRAIQGRTISHLLLKQNQFSTDSSEMMDVKNQVAGIEMMLNREWNADNAMETVQELEAAYAVTIMFCQKYCDCKHPTFRSGKERKQMVQETLMQLQTELDQLHALKHMIENGQMPLDVYKQKDLLVAAQEYQAGQETQEEESLQEEQPISIGTLTYADFASMLGTYNRGQIEFSKKGLRMINNHALSVSEGSVSAENYQLRERLFILAKEKIGEQLTAGVSYQIQGLLGLDSEKKESKPLSRKELYEVITAVNMRSSQLSRTLKAKDQAPESRRVFAEKVNGLIGGQLGEWDVTYTTEQIEQEMKKELAGLFKTAGKNGVEIPKLSKHQMDVLVKGNLPMLLDGLFASMNSVYDMMCRINQGNDVDINTVAGRDTLIYQLMSYEISKITAETPELRKIAEQEQKSYITAMAFSLSEKNDLKEDFEHSFVGDLTVKGSEGLEQAIKRQLPESSRWQTGSLRMQRGFDSLKHLCDQLQELSMLQKKALEQGLDDAEYLQMRNLANGIQQLVQPMANNQANETMVDMEFVTKELADTRFASGLEKIKSLVSEQNFSFIEAVERIEAQVRPLQVNRTIEEQNERPDMDRMTGHVKSQMEKMSKPTKQVLGILMLEKKASELVEKSKDNTSGEILALRRALLRLENNQQSEAAERVTLAGAKVQLVRDKMGVLSLVEGRHIVTLPFGTRMLLDRLEADLLEHESLFEQDDIVSIVEALHEQDFDAQSGGEMVRSRSLCLKVLQSRTGKSAAFFNNVSNRRLTDYALYLLKGVTTEEDVIKDVDKIENAALINGEEALELLKKNEKVRAREKRIKTQRQAPEVKNAGTDQEPEWQEKELRVKNMLSDLIFSTQTWELDENERATTEPLKEAKQAEDAKRIEQIKKVQSAERMRGVLLNHTDALYAVIREPQLLEQMVNRLPFPGTAVGEGEAEGSMKQEIHELVRQMIEMPQLAKLREAAHGPFEAFAKIGFKMMIGPMLRKDDAVEELAKMDAQINDMVEKSMNSIQDMITDSVSVVFKPDHKSGGKKKLNRESYTDKKKWQSDSREELNRLLREAANGDRGQGLFTKNVFQNYFVGVSRMDQRAMLASALRGAKPMEEAAANLSQKEKDAHKKKVMGNYLGGILKGAGPLLQKMLQGMPLDSMPEELKSALKDMRSNLAPIPDEIVQAQLRSMIERSQGKVEEIEIVRALGAASVGQAFLCRFKGPDLPAEGKDVVVKLLRPNVRNHMMREKKIMLECAKLTDMASGTLPDEIGGMEATYMGQLMRIEEELDLTIEARNVERGRLYDEGVSTVGAMKLNPLVEPTVNAMVVEKAPGTTLDKYMDQARRILRENMATFEQKDADGNIRKNINGKPMLKYNENADFNKTYAELNELNLKLRKSQQYLLTLADKWVTEGVFGKGFYHGDLHAGNIMVDDDGMTIIDFGNATQLNHEQQCHVVKMMLAASCRMVDDFRHGFHMLLQNTSPEKYEEKREELGKMLEEVFEMGTQEDTGSRIAVALLKAQELGLELPPAIANFSQSQIRLQQTIEELNNMIKQVSEAMVRLRYEQMHCSSLIDIQKNIIGVANNNEDKAQSCAEVRRRFPIDLSREEFLKSLYAQKTEMEQAEFEQNCIVHLGPDASYMEQMEELMKEVSPEILANAQAGGEKAQTTLKQDIRKLGLKLCLKLKEVQNQYDEGINDEARRLITEVRRCVSDPFAPGFLDELNTIQRSIVQMKTYEQEKLNEFTTGYRERVQALRQLKEEPNHSAGELEKKESEFFDFYMKRQLQMIKSEGMTAAGIEQLLSMEDEKDAGTMFHDESFMGQEFREAYHRYREAKAANSTELPQASFQMQSIYMQILSHKIKGMYDVLEHSIPFEQMRKPLDTFFDVMGDVIMTNKKAAAGRIGLFYGMKVTMKQQKIAEDEA